MLQARFAGPYIVEMKLSNTDDVICTPDRKRKSCICHVNMLKSYAARSTEGQNPSDEVSCVAADSVISICVTDYSLTKKNATALGARFQNSQTFDQCHLKRIMWLIFQIFKRRVFFG